jgi:hypothetical protein
MSGAMGDLKKDPALEEFERLLSNELYLPQLEFSTGFMEKNKDEGPFRGKFVGVAAIAIGFNCFCNMGLVYARADAQAEVIYLKQDLNTEMELHPLFDQLGLHPSNIKKLTIAGHTCLDFSRGTRIFL